MLHRTQRGFTLIEVLVVVTIIGILASITLLGLGPARRSAQDARRIADLRNVQSALEVYFNQVGNYPVQSAKNTVDLAQTAYTNMLGALQLRNIIPSANQPNDTPADVRGYGYESNADGSRYILAAILDGSRPTGFIEPNYAGFQINAAGTGYCTTAGVQAEVANSAYYCVSL